MKILINTPSLHFLGGVSNHYKGLRAYWKEDVLYNTVGKRNPKKNGSGKYWLLWDTIKFVFRLLVFRPNVVIVNPSLGTSALKRDFYFLNIANRLGFKVVVFIHGFNLNYAKNINKEWVAKNLNKASLIFVLANAFKSEIRTWGVMTPIMLTTTKVNDALLEGYNVREARKGEAKNILFLARIEKEKGIFVVLESYKILKKKYPYLRLTIVGDGSSLPTVKQMVHEEQIPDVTITGGLYGKGVADAYKNADIYFLPSHGEGMPTSVLEAMAFGLPVFTRNVGGLVDFFEDGKMGYITDSLDPAIFAKAMIPYIENKDFFRKVGLSNAEYAKDHFMASNVAHQLESLIKKQIMQ